MGGRTSTTPVKRLRDDVHSPLGMDTTHEFATPDGPVLRPNPSFDVSPPTPPRRDSNSPASSPLSGKSPESPATLANRRATAGRLPNSALLSLRQMKFDAIGVSSPSVDGLGVGPGSAGFVGDFKDLQPGSGGRMPGMTFRMAMESGGMEGYSSSPKGSPVVTPGGTENTPALASPSLLSGAPVMRNFNSSGNRRRLMSLTSGPGSPLLSPEVKIPPSLRGSKLLDKLNLSPLTPTRERGMSSPSAFTATPPSPAILRSSAYSYFNMGPMTPLTPGQLPNCPKLEQHSQFAWSSYSLPSPGCPADPHSQGGGGGGIKSIFGTGEGLSSPTQNFFLPTPPTEQRLARFRTGGGGGMSSPLGIGLAPSLSGSWETPGAKEEGGNPFFQ